MSHTREQQLAELSALIDTLDILRVKCPWDAKQTNESLRPNTIEEVYELAQALLNNDVPDIKKELGDVLLHILFYSKIADEKGQFDIADVARALNDKLIFRHPHVFGEVKVGDAHEVEQNWEQIKLRERGGNRSVLAGVPESLPALIKALRVQEKAANAGFDWEKPADVWSKVKEEVSEVEEELTSDKGQVLDGEAHQQHLEEELGDLMFAVVNAVRLYGVNPENALERANRKFIRRFNFIEKAANEAGTPLKELSLDQMEEYWAQAKKLEREAEK